MANPHLQIIQAAVASNKQLGVLFNQAIGTKEHPRGALLNAFRQARQNLRGNVGKPVASVILNQYRAEVVESVRAGARRAVEVGREQAKKNALALGVSIFPTSQGDLLITQAVNSVSKVVDNQITAMQSGLLTEAQVLGEEGQVGLFAPGAIQRETANSFANLAALIFSVLMLGRLDTPGSTSPFLRQAIAAIDNKTTPCCLGVHGQTVELDQPFTTPDPPAFARVQDRPPFHWNCRTAQGLVLREMAQDDLTQIMRQAAALERQLRGTADYTVPTYINAFTRFRE